MSSLSDSSVLSQPPAVAHSTALTATGVGPSASPGAVDTVDVVFRVLWGVEEQAVSVAATVPLAVSVAEVFDEVVHLCGVALPDCGWCVQTAAGSPIDPAIPLADSPVSNGDTLVIAPVGLRPAPVVLDAAEAASSIGEPARPAGIAAVASAAGFLATAAAIGQVVPAQQQPWAWWAVMMVCAIVLMRLQNTRPTDQPSAIVLATLVWVFAQVGAWRWMQPGSTHPHPASPLAITTVGICGLVAAALMALVWRSDPPAGGGRALSAGGAGWLTLLGVLSVAVVCAGAGLRLGGLSAAAGAVVLGCVVVLTVAARVAQSVAGLQVPVLPAVVSVGDGDAPADGDGATATVGQAMIARDIVIGAYIAASVGAMVGLGLLAFAPSTTTALVALAVAAGFAPHGLRHRDAACLWSLWSLSSVALLVAVWAAVSAPAHPAVVAVAVVGVAAAATAPLWAGSLKLNPAQGAWLERLEIFALAAAVPLVLHAMGVFALVRGLGA
ncbi:type VII secretion integral membrane protein EccD [Corynebacterium aquilae]|uniref:EccD-like transmembrane domain-containing protein n=1 Tax=Corynebacterium aquilae DSM 44791 TaxID=1431546 RepID=A0A1L7CDY0_9CORY|nr:type VII secretion integral membrane protein EccD [Corynebacterium aquilae]APT84070.1 hypothetical protein CAQU_02150 [Corynebacterium aquilae DSM 44791]